MSLVIFDLDNTLIGGDSDHLWGEFLVDQGHVDAITYKQQNDRFYSDYQSGSLDIHEYLTFALEPLTRFTLTELSELHRQFMTEKIQPIILPKAMALIEHHRNTQATLLIITATNRFVTEPIAAQLGISNLLATDAELISERYTGRVLGTPCFQKGKVARLEAWLQEHKVPLNDSYFYSDSANDIPLLEYVTNPVAVDPDPQLANYANKKGFPIISLR